MINIFDYTFYRIMIFYKKKGNQIADTFASGAITIIQCFIILDLLILVRIIYEYAIPDNFNKFWLIPLAITFMLFNWYRYEKGNLYLELRKKWKDERIDQKRKRGRLIIVTIIVILLIPILYGVIRHNIIGGKGFFN